MAFFISRLLAIHLLLQLMGPLSFADEENGAPAEEKVEDAPKKAPSLNLSELWAVVNACIL